MRRLGEPNETHLGYSRGRSDGRGLTGKRAIEFADKISQSKAAATGLLQDLEDTALFVPKIREDLLSDMTTQIIRGPLIRYTQRMCEFHEIPMEQQYSGHLWNPDSLDVGRNVCGLAAYIGGYTHIHSEVDSSAQSNC